MAYSAGPVELDDNCNQTHSSGSFIVNSKLCCKKQACDPKWRTACSKSDLACKQKHCPWFSAPDNALCDANPCYRGYCKKGACLGLPKTRAATYTNWYDPHQGSPGCKDKHGHPYLPWECPPHPEQCKMYQCSLATGKCDDVVLKPDNTTCDYGVCINGICTPQCPISPDKCTPYVLDPATGLCLGKPVKCLNANKCQVNACNLATGQCEVSNKPDNTPCPGGQCSNGICKPTGCPLDPPNKCSVYVFEPVSRNCTLKPVTCPASPDDCKDYVCSPATGQCVTVNRPDNTSCPDGLCVSGICKPSTICPPAPDKCSNYVFNSTTNRCDLVPVTCPLSTDPCKVNQCNPTTGRCTAVNKPDNTTCPGGVCVSGSCKVPLPCPPNPDLCNKYVIDPSTRNCTLKPVTCPANPDDCKINQCSLATGQCVTNSRPDGTPCPGGTCQAGNCTGTELTCPPDPDPCAYYVNNGVNCTLVTRPDNTTCSDGRRCTTGDVCWKGKCTGTPKTCMQPGLQCVNAVCNEATGDCVNVQSPDGSNCTDNNLCTSNDTCYAGTCVGLPKSCGTHSNQCKSLQCDPKTGVCETENKPDTAACNDGKFCTLNDICVGGLCTGTPKLCPTPKDLASQCKEGVCSEASQGQCQLLPKPDGSTCNVPGTGSCSVDTCKNGQCEAGTITDCSALSDPCNNGQCNPANGTCIKVPKPNGSTCDDGLACTANDVCTNGACAGTPRVCPVPLISGTCLTVTCSEPFGCLLVTKDCSALNDQCNVGACSPFTNDCAKVPNNEGGSCTDGNSCTVSDKCIGGTCYGEPKQCPPSTDQCKINTCDPTSTTGACKPVPVENGTPCTGSTSQGLCTVGDFCQAGMCVAGAPKNCSALDDDCNIGVCEIATGKCKKQPRANGTPCNDGLFCTINEFCTSGVCGGGVTRECPTQGKCEKERVCNETSNTCDIVVPVDCSSKDGQCAKGSCDPATGLCTAAPINENKPCSDGLFCTSGEVCKAGVCTGGTQTTCPNTDPCVVVSCIEGPGGAGQCTTTPKQCPSTECAVGQCLSSGPSAGSCTLLPKPSNTTCTGPTPCVGKCDGAGQCVEQCPPTPCQNDNACNPGGGSAYCCCDGECKAKVPGTTSCGFTCADNSCKKAGASQGYTTCHCISACAGNECSSVGGNPCKNNGVCCCGKKPGASFENCCIYCREPCTGQGTCTGNLPVPDQGKVCNSIVSAKRRRTLLGHTIPPWAL